MYNFQTCKLLRLQKHCCSDIRIPLHKHSDLGTLFVFIHLDIKYRGRRDRDRMVVGFTTTCAIATKIVS
jgi:hypothetical protein